MSNVLERVGYAEVIGAASGGTANAGWFGDGRDGDLHVADGETLSLEVDLDEGQVVKQYGSGYIGTGATLTAANRCNGMVLLFNGDLTINGHIHMDKKAPLLNSNEDEAAKEMHIALCGGLIGGDGGAGGNGYARQGSTIRLRTSGGTGGNGHRFGGGFPGGGGGSGDFGDKSEYPYDGSPGEPRPPIGTVLPYPGTTNGIGQYGTGGGAGNYNGGSAPGGGGAAQSGDAPGPGSTGDGYPGGAIFVFVKGRVTINATGSITANGGNGGAGRQVNSPSGAGGGGGGGIVVVVHNGDYTNAGSVAANGGLGGASANATLTPDSVGSDGNAGTVLIATLAELLAG